VPEAGLVSQVIPAAPLVSVIMPMHNGEHYLVQAVESVLAQTYSTRELILIDDGSTDGSARLARRFGSALRYEYQSNAGQSAARNRGIQLAHGPLLAFLDDDDYWSLEKLTLQVAVLDDNPSVEAVFGHVRQFVSPDLEPEAAARVRYHAEIMPGYVPGTMLIRRQSFDRVGRFDPQRRVGEFVDWYSRAVEIGLRTFLMPDVVLHRRLHDDNEGIKQRAESVQYVRVLKAALDRRRVGHRPQEGRSGTAPGE
jgi:glycosyltransferase involved in cell wall biosynthesis